jgi:hypothetical protein
MVAEFLVIVVGVLVALTLSVDSWVSWRQDRALEVEYLERLLEDVEYDLSEIGSVEAVATAGRAYADSLLTAGAVDKWDAAHLVGALVLASNSRQPDLSRSTFQELVSSGRIGLMRSRSLRTGLANYDRLFLELVGFWDRAPPDFQVWVRSRIPNKVIGDFRAACSLPEAPFVSDPTNVCLFEIQGWSADDVRADLSTEEALHLITLQTWRIGGTLDIAVIFRAAAEDLRATIEQELREPAGAL